MQTQKNSFETSFLNGSLPQANRRKIIIWKKQQNLQISENRRSMSLNALRNRAPSLQQSRVSSSSSNSSQGYELIPREQPYLNPARDIASPKASFPFRKVQAGNESAIGNKSVNDSRSSIKGSVKDENQSREIIQVIGQFRPTIRDVEQYRQPMKNSSVHEDCRLRIQEANQKIEELQKRLQQERYQFEFERKANEIYTDEFAKIREMILKRQANFQGESIEQMVLKLEQILEAKVMVDPGNSYHIIEEQDRKIRELRAQLLKSTQNNINAIFNTQITEACLLQSQIQKMNVEIMNLRQKLVKATTDNQQNITKILQSNSNHPQVQKIIKYYNFPWDSESEGEQIGKDMIRRRKDSKQNKLRQSRQRISSEKSHRNLINTQNKFHDMIEGYRALKQDYSKLVTVLSQINTSQSDFKESFSTMKKDITLTIQNEIKNIKQSVNRPSSNHQQIRIGKQLQIKLNDLVNTLNAPQKANIERQLEEEDNNNWRGFETVRRFAQLEAKNIELERELKKICQERDNLQETVLRTFANKPPLFSDI